MTIRFSKMHGLGNDFVVIDAINQSITLTPEQIRTMADRRFGIGFDQLLLVEAPTNPAVDFRYRIFNADGGEVEQCGNGARCFARFIQREGLTDKNDIRVETNNGLIGLQVEADEQVTVNMGAPRFEPNSLPFLANERATTYPLRVDGNELEISAISMGNPHAVLLVDNIDTAPLETLGPLLESHPSFPQRVNVGFMQKLTAHHIRLRVYERGAGETLACGTGACAAMVAGRQRGILADSVQVDLPGGSLHINWQGENEPVYMTGPATFVFDGKIEL